MVFFQCSTQWLLYVLNGWQVKKEWWTQTALCTKKNYGCLATQTKRGKMGERKGFYIKEESSMSTENTAH